jgi:hypothetical protein
MVPDFLTIAEAARLIQRREQPYRGTQSGRNRWFVDSLLEGDGFELSVPRERGYRPELSTVIYVPETVRVLPNKYTVATALAALVELHQNAKRSPCRGNRASQRGETGPQHADRSGPKSWAWLELCLCSDRSSIERGA